MRLLMDGCVFTLAFPALWLRIVIGVMNSSAQGPPNRGGQRGSIYYSGLAQGRRNNREEMGGGCISKPGLRFPSLSPRFRLAVAKLQAQASGLAH